MHCCSQKSALVWSAAGAAAAAAGSLHAPPKLARSTRFSSVSTAITCDRKSPQGTPKPSRTVGQRHQHCICAVHPRCARVVGSVTFMKTLLERCSPSLLRQKRAPSPDRSTVKQRIVLNSAQRIRIVECAYSALKRTRMRRMISTTFGLVTSVESRYAFWRRFSSAVSAAGPPGRLRPRPEITGTGGHPAYTR